MMLMLAIAMGAALGALARWGIAELWRDTDSHRIPWPTFTANIAASFILGVLIRIVGSSAATGAELAYALIGIGFCGALSTMSTFAVELMMMVRHRALVSALGYLTLTLGLALAAFWAGLMVVP